MSTSGLDSHGFTVDRERAKAALQEGPIRLYLSTELPTDISPHSAYRKFSGRSDTGAIDSGYQFLLESAAKADSSDPSGAYGPDGPVDDRTRFSFLGYDPDGVVTIEGESVSYTDLGDDPLGDGVTSAPPSDAGLLDGLRAFMPDATPIGRPSRNRHRLDGGLVGFLAYEAVYDLWMRDTPVDPPSRSVPDASFVVNTKTLVFDHREDRLSLVLTPVIDTEDSLDGVLERADDEADRVTDILTTESGGTVGAFTLERTEASDRRRYERAVETVRERIAAGEVYQTVISREETFDGTFDPLPLYAALKHSSPSPYMYLLEFDDRSIVGASPETLVTVADHDGHRRVVANPIAGTTQRGGSPAEGAPDPVEDRRLAGELLADDKERAEHTMLVDLTRNDLRRVCRGGSVRVTEFMAVRKYSHVQHIESEVVGELDDGYDALDAIRSVFPAGTLSGAPKLRSMELISELEDGPRGVYGGGVGYLSFAGEADLAIVIRTATIGHGETDRLSIRAGAGVVAASDPADEFDETASKLDGLSAAIDLALHDGDRPREVIDDER